MKSLLKSSSRRQMEIIELLIEHDGWITISSLADELNSSTRILKDDIAFFRDTYDDIIIETSHLGVRITMDQTSGIKDFYRSILESSLPFQALAIIFFDETLSINDLAEKLFSSSSTMYRTIDQLNDYFAERGCRVETNPCRLVGDELYIRNFYRTYFKETSTVLEWPFPGYDELEINKTFDKIMSFLSSDSDIEASTVDFAFYESIKLTVIVNVARYEHGHLIDTKDIERTSFKFLFQAIKLFILPKYMKKIRNKPLTTEYIYQVFYSYLRENAAFGKKPLVKLRQKNADINNALTFLEESLYVLSKDININIDIDDILVAVYGTTYIESDDANGKYILYNRNKLFAKSIKHSFPYIYDALYEAVVGYRLRLNQELDEDKINYLLYTLFTNWENLLTDLYTKYQRVSILVLSDGHFSHAKMIQNLLRFELRRNLDIQVYHQAKISKALLQNYDCDLIISSFKLPEFDNKETIVINYFPTFPDISRIEKLINVIIQRKTTPVESIDYHRT